MADMASRLSRAWTREDNVYRVSGSGERRDKVALFYNDKPAATRGNCNNYAKTECNGASRPSEQGGPARTEELKRKKRRTFQGTERKRSNARQDGGGDGMQKRLRR